ncbi:MAG: hypothetical protein A3G38_04075 [Omnitrophica WOR_2 bacterium RIFCSPLOWO2_12_FULL_51_8]|nr:MAG: hypothetical protein A3G38_04075 [Omnitrophica WOR_2 bacterium RIFCSPLOWO2_12_FULL_51_8]
MREDNDNQEVMQKLSRLVVEKITGRQINDSKVIISPLMINYFSFVFSIEVSNSQNTQKVFVKIPKEDIRQGPKAILPISSADRRLAEDEAHSLRTLAEQWRSKDLGVSWVRLVGEVPDYNALVMSAEEGDEALTVFRRLDLRRRFGNCKARYRLREAMSRLGTALGRFHLQNTAEGDFFPDLATPKILKYLEYVGACTRSVWLSRVVGLIERFGTLPIAGVMTSTLKGIDIRNVLLDDDGHIVMFDPGRMKMAYREEDLARFLMTWRMLYWGTGWFALGLRPDPVSEAAFLDCYYEVMGPTSDRLLDFFMFKEILKSWYIAYIALSLKTWPQHVNRLVARYYIDRFFEGQLVLQSKKFV